MLPYLCVFARSLERVPHPAVDEIGRRGGRRVSAAR